MDFALFLFEKHLNILFNKQKIYFFNITEFQKKITKFQCGMKFTYLYIFWKPNDFMLLFLLLRQGLYFSSNRLEKNPQGLYKKIDLFKQGFFLQNYI